MNTHGVDETLKQLYALAYKYRVDMRVRAWAESSMRAWKKQHGAWPTTDQEIGEALLNGFRKIPYVPNPTTEFVTAPAMIFRVAELPDKFFRTTEFPAFGMDADDAAVALGAAAMSVGCEVAFIGQSFDNKMGIHHVIVAIRDEDTPGDNWLRYDPCYGKGPEALKDGKQPVDERWVFEPSETKTEKEP